MWFQACCEESYKAVAAHWVTQETLYNPNAWASPERLIYWTEIWPRHQDYFNYPKWFYCAVRFENFCLKELPNKVYANSQIGDDLDYFVVIERVEVVYREADSYIFWEDLGLILRLHHTTVDSPEHSILARSPGCFSANHTESLLGLLSFTACVWKHSPWISNAFPWSSLEQE